MSRLEELIAELCPNGVEYKTLGFCVQKINSIKWESTDDLFRYIDLSSVDRNTHKIIETIQINKENAPSRAQQIVYHGDILFGTTRPLLKRYCQITKAYHTQVCSTGFCVLRPNIKIVNNRWIYHIISSSDFMGYVEKHQQGANYPSISDSNVKNYKIPVPPLPIQEEIVRILDNFAELTAELTAELNKRKKQYQYYRDYLLAFDKRAATRQTTVNSILWKKIKDVCKNVSSGGTPLKSKSSYYNGSIPWIRTQEVKFCNITKTEMTISQAGLDNSSAKWIPENCVIVAISGATAARCAVNKIPLTTNQHCCNLEINSDIALYRYVFYWISSQYEQLKALGQGAREDLNVGRICNYPIPLPPLAEQTRIVSILDRFDALCNDLTSGLPAEIEARKKQYEYYRDKLLTFKEAA